jgi:hypothetical protein
MAKVTMMLCDVAPCTYIADRQFEVNGQTVYVCGESCFVKFWSREYRNWKKEGYHMKAYLQQEDPEDLAGSILKKKHVSSGGLRIIQSFHLKDRQQ